jgi:activator of HSP90 ATPase
MPRTVLQTIDLPASSKALYAMYLDPDQHAAFTGGGPARIVAKAGTEWSAFDGRIYGRVLSLVPDRMIVQTWRSFEWEDSDLDAILVLTFWSAGAGTRVELTQANVPDRLYETLLTGWPGRYWDPWRSFLQSGKQSR